MSFSKTLLTNTNDQINVIGEPVNADGWYGYSHGKHTVSIHTINFSGRVRIQASLLVEPTAEDWFDIDLHDETPYLQFPLNDRAPTGRGGGDTGCVAVTFRANILWVRAIVERDYLTPVQPYDGRYGTVNQILLGS